MDKRETRHITIQGHKITLVFSDEPNTQLTNNIKSSLLDNWIRQKGIGLE